MLKSEGVAAITPLLSENKINRNIRFHTFQKSVDIQYMLIVLCNNCLRVVCAHRYNYLFSRETFSSYVEFWFIFQPFVISNIMDFNNLAGGQFGKSILDFDDLLDIAFRSLYVWLYAWLFELEA